MNRRGWLALLISCCACRKPPPPEILLPPAVAGVWQRRSLTAISVLDAPAAIPRSSLVRAWKASYEGPGSVTVDLYELASSAIALEVVQKWRAEANAVFFYRDQYFANVKWQNADRGQLTRFVRELENQIAGPRGSAPAVR